MQTARELSLQSRLWRSVLGQAVRDIYSGEMGHRLDTIRWLKTNDFKVVCDFAEVEPGAMREQIAALAALPDNLARKYGKLLRDKIMEGIHQE